MFKTHLEGSKQAKVNVGQSPTLRCGGKTLNLRLKPPQCGKMSENRCVREEGVEVPPQEVNDFLICPQIDCSSESFKFEIQT